MNHISLKAVFQTKTLLLGPGPWDQQRIFYQLALRLPNTKKIRNKLYINYGQNANSLDQALLIADNKKLSTLKVYILKASAQQQTINQSSIQKSLKKSIQTIAQQNKRQQPKQVPFKELKKNYQPNYQHIQQKIQIIQKEQSLRIQRLEQSSGISQEEKDYQIQFDYKRNPYQLNNKDQLTGLNNFDDNSNRFLSNFKDSTVQLEQQRFNKNTQNNAQQLTKLNISNIPQNPKDAKQKHEQVQQMQVKQMLQHLSSQGSQFQASQYPCVFCPSKASLICTTCHNKKHLPKNHPITQLIQSIVVLKINQILGTKIFSLIKDNVQQANQGLKTKVKVIQGKVYDMEKRVKIIKNTQEQIINQISQKAQTNQRNPQKNYINSNHQNQKNNHINHQNHQKSHNYHNQSNITQSRASHSIRETKFRANIVRAEPDKAIYAGTTFEPTLSIQNIGSSDWPAKVFMIERIKKLIIPIKSLRSGQSITIAIEGEKILKAGQNIQMTYEIYYQNINDEKVVFSNTLKIFKIAKNIQQKVNESINKQILQGQRKKQQKPIEQKNKAQNKRKLKQDLIKLRSKLNCDFITIKQMEQHLLDVYQIQQDNYLISNQQLEELIVQFIQSHN